MSAWDFVSPATLLAIQRKMKLDQMGHEARVLLKAGYPVEADQVMDAMADADVDE